MKSAKERTKKNIQNNEGVAIVEFAILLPVLITIIFGMIEFGVLMFNKQVITNASREGARAGIVQSIPRLSDSEIETIVNNYCQDHLITFGAPQSTATTISRTGDSFSDDLTVSVSYHYDFFVLPSFVGSLIGGIDLLADTVMKLE